MQVDIPLKIIGLGRYLPKRVVPSSELEVLCGVPAGWVERRNGVRDLGEGVLHHGVGGVVAHRGAQLGQLLHGQTAVLGEHGRARTTERVRQLGDGC